MSLNLDFLKQHISTSFFAISNQDAFVLNNISFRMNKKSRGKDSVLSKKGRVLLKRQMQLPTGGRV
ncbi:MAG: hypothetical protein DMG05_02745 [Acidobacteria bacterium]|nr:MAG: hypothetical protein DMG05_02745 [Acidobacteriota bacterium]